MYFCYNLPLEKAVALHLNKPETPVTTHFEKLRTLNKIFKVR